MFEALLLLFKCSNYKEITKRITCYHNHIVNQYLAIEINNTTTIPRIKIVGVFDAEKAEEVIKLCQNKSIDSSIEYVSSMIPSIVEKEFIGMWN